MRRWSIVVGRFAIRLRFAEGRDFKSQIANYKFQVSRLDLPFPRPYPQLSRPRLDAATWMTDGAPTLSLPPENLTVATTGASGSIFLKHLLLAIERDPRVKTVNFIASDSGLRVMSEELGVEGRSDLLRQIIGAASAKIQPQSNSDIGANVASGSYPSDAMVVIPCSVGTLGRIANGTASRLIERAADVTLKERRPLLLCVRETPLNRIHIRNMALAADAGATIFPLIPTFYNHPPNADAMAQEFANRVLAHIGLAQSDAYRWKATPVETRLAASRRGRRSKPPLEGC